MTDSQPAVLEVVRPGPLTLIQDLGRPGLAAIGVGRSGAADRVSWRRGAALVGNADDAAALEVLLGGLTVRVHRGARMAVTGAELPVTCDRIPVDTGAAFDVADGVTVRLGTARRGLRGYLSVSGGIEVPAVLGSRSADTLAGLGPRRLHTGDRLPIGTPTAAAPAVIPPAPDLPTGELTLRVVRGPRDDWFADPEALIGTPWSMSPDSNRVGLRLDGDPLRRSGSGDGELPSEGMVRGCLQVPPDGRPVLLMPDHPVTGGYPVIGVVVDADVDRAAQARPGQPIRFRWADSP